MITTILVHHKWGQPRAAAWFLGAAGYLIEDEPSQGFEDVALARCVRTVHNAQLGDADTLNLDYGIVLVCLVGRCREVQRLLFSDGKEVLDLKL